MSSRRCSSKGADPNARESSWGQTPLVFAAEYDRPAAIQVLLKHGADPSIHTRVLNLSDDAAREQAAEKEAARGAHLVRAAGPARLSRGGLQEVPRCGEGRGTCCRPAGADSNAQAAGQAGGRGNQLPVREPRGPFTPEQIQAAIDSGRAVLTAASVPKDSVKEQVDTLNGGVEGFIKQVGSMGGLTALHHAVRQGNLDAALALLDGGANINDTSLVDGTTPLLMAIINGQFDVAHAAHRAWRESEHRQRVGDGAAVRDDQLAVGAALALSRSRRRSRRRRRRTSS